MQKKILEYLNALVCGYVILICAVLPLYMQNGFVMIGDAKYAFFLTVSILFLLLFLAGFAPFLTVYKQKRGIGWSALDMFVALYGISVIVSFLGSPYKEIALWGYTDWHMGLITQLFFVWGYFFVSRCFGKDKFVWKIIWIASTIVFTIGMLNRYQFDPLGNFREIDIWDWNHANLLSTIGNINWYCGYLCLTLPLSWYFMWKGKGKERAAGYIFSFIGNVSLFTQGSMGGYVGAGAVLIVLFCISLQERAYFLKFLQVLILFVSAPLFINVTILLAPRGLQIVDSNVLDWRGWMPCLIFLLALYFVVKKCFFAKKPVLPLGEGTRRIVRWAVLWGVLGSAALFAIFRFYGALQGESGISAAFNLDAEWGSGRGALWKAAVQCFMRGDWRQKLIGAGPDCYACVVYELTDLRKELHVTGQWEGAIFANAHNEWLNMLVTGGVAGMMLYCGIFCSAFCGFWIRQKDNPIFILGLMIITGYCAYGLGSFQQIVTTPFAFAILGMLESYRREESLTRSI